MGTDSNVQQPLEKSIQTESLIPGMQVSLRAPASADADIAFQIRVLGIESPEPWVACLLSCAAVEHDDSRMGTTDSLFLLLILAFSQVLQMSHLVRRS